MPLQNRLTTTLIYTALLASACGSARSQAPTAWAELVIPQGVVNTSIKGQGKLVTYDVGTSLHVFSAVTRRWHFTHKPPSASVRVFNDCVVIVEPNGCQAFSSYSGKFSSVTTTGNCTIINAAGNKNDSIVLVTAGNQVHAFSAFTGTWTSRTVTPLFAATVQRHVAVLADGTTIAGLSAYERQWQEHDAGAAVVSLDARGSTAFANTATTNFAFSSQTRTWKASPVLANATFTRGDDWGLWFANGALVAYSGLRGTFMSGTPGVTAIAGTSDLYALLTTPSGLCAFSAVTGDLLQIPQHATSIDVGGAAAFLHSTGSTRGYSPLQQTVATLPISASSAEISNIIGYVTTSSGQSYAWSSLTGSWHQAPVATNGAPPVLTTTTLGCATPNDCYAFGPKTGHFVQCHRSLLGLATNVTSAPLLGYDATTLVAFDTDTERWVESPRNSIVTPTFQIWRTSGLVLDGTVAHGFGAQNGIWHSHSLSPGTAYAFTNSEVAYVRSPNHIAACSMLPEIVSFQQFPHFRRIQPRDAPISFAVAAPINSVVIVAFAPAAHPTSIPGLGSLLLDPNRAILEVVVPAPNHPVTSLSLNLSADMIMAGTTLISQMLVIPENAPPYLSNRTTVQLW